MRNFEDTFETRKRSLFSVFSICMTVSLKKASYSNAIEKKVNSFQKFSHEKRKMVHFKPSQI